MGKSLKELTLPDISKLTIADLSELLNELFSFNEVTKQINNNENLKTDNILGSTIYDYFKDKIYHFGNLLNIYNNDVVNKNYTRIVDGLIYIHYSKVKKLPIHPFNEDLSKFLLNYNLSRCESIGGFFNNDTQCGDFQDFAKYNAVNWVASRIVNSPVSGNNQQEGETIELPPASFSQSAQESKHNSCTALTALTHWDQCEDHTWGIIWIILICIVVVVGGWLVYKYQVYKANQANINIHNALNTGVEIANQSFRDYMKHDYKNKKEYMAQGYQNTTDRLSALKEKMTHKPTENINNVDVINIPIV